MKHLKYTLITAVVALVTLGCTQIDLNTPASSTPSHMALASGVKVAEGIQFTLSIPLDQSKTENLPLCGAEVSGGYSCVIGPIPLKKGATEDLSVSRLIPLEAQVQRVESPSLMMATLPALPAQGGDADQEPAEKAPDILWQGVRGEVTSSTEARNHILRWIAVPNSDKSGKSFASAEQAPVELALPGLRVTFHSTLDMDHRF